MTKVGSRQLVFQDTFLVPHGEPFETEINNDILIMPLVISFIDATEENPQGKMVWTVGETKLTVTFYGRTPPIGATIKEPIIIGDIDGRSLGFRCAMTGHNGLNVLHFQLVMDLESKGEPSQP